MDEKLKQLGDSVKELVKEQIALELDKKLDSIIEFIQNLKSNTLPAQPNKQVNETLSSNYKPYSARPIIATACLNCQDLFETRSKRKKYCSDKCRRDYFRRKHNDPIKNEELLQQGRVQFQESEKPKTTAEIGKQKRAKSASLVETPKNSIGTEDLYPKQGEAQRKRRLLEKKMKHRLDPDIERNPHIQLAEDYDPVWNARARDSHRLVIGKHPPKHPL